MARSIKLLELQSTSDLRKECSRMGIKKVLRNGLEVPTSHAKKTELVEAISMKESEIDLSQREVKENIFEEIEETTVGLVHPETTTESIEETIEESLPHDIADYPNYQEKVKWLTNRFYLGFTTSDGLKIAGIEDLANYQMAQSEKGLSKQDNRLIATIIRFRQEILANAESNSSIINLRTDVVNSLRKVVKKEYKRFVIERTIDGIDTPIIEDFLTQVFESFRTGVIASFGDISREKREGQGENFLNRRTNTPHASVSRLIEWAVNRLKSALPSRSQEWKEIALAIMVVTGRRPAEVMSNGVFKAVNEVNVNFHGQLKKKGETDEKVYRIPCIGNTAKEVEGAIAWLEMMNKRVIPLSRDDESLKDSARKSHDRFSRYLSEVAEAIFPQYLDLAEGATWKLNDERSRIKPYLARQIYLQIVSEKVNKSTKQGFSIDASLAITYYSGHYLSIDGKDSSAENYSADLLINDIEEIEKIWQWKPDLTESDIKELSYKR